MGLFFSFVIPVYNRPNEIMELLESLLRQTYDRPYEIVIVEDGSTLSSEEVVAGFKDRLSITYLTKKNTGPGDSRNYGMRHAKGNYFIVLDSDCILPPHYLTEVDESLTHFPVDCYGGPDAAHPSFSNVQKAINHTMTSFLTTGGIRGKKASVNKFQPRSFNMGISKEAFKATGGYGNIHPGEDPDLTIRIWKAGFGTRLIPNAFVYHKRRINWNKFYVQVNKFGKVRPILNLWHRGTATFSYWFPTLFCFGFLGALTFWIFGPQPFSSWPILAFIGYFGVVFFDALLRNRSLSIAFLSLIALGIQFYGYGLGFLKSTILVNFSKRKPEALFPDLFFEKV
ncbi:glycosyltransferase [Spongiimicrobium sp. 2-473A-2-J]|uniref:glycosyltransferase n=1 Tax=Eudoraea algarum TaxID=3417568 RepID=UPI003D36B9DD